MLEGLKTILILNKMRSLNKVQLIGNVGKKPELTTFESGSTKCKFSMATNLSYKDKDGVVKENTQWHNIVIWGILGSVVEKHVKVGDPVYVEGRIETREYEGKYYTEIICDNIIMLGVGGEKKQEPEVKPGGKKKDTPEVDDQPTDDLPF